MYFFELTTAAGGVFAGVTIIGRWPILFLLRARAVRIFFTIAFLLLPVRPNVRFFMRTKVISFQSMPVGIPYNLALGIDKLHGRQRERERCRN